MVRDTRTRLAIYNEKLELVFISSNHGSVKGITVGKAELIAIIKAALSEIEESSSLSFTIDLTQ